MDYVIKPGAGRDDFVRYWRLIAEEVKDHPSAFAFELMLVFISYERRVRNERKRTPSHKNSLTGVDRAMYIIIFSPLLSGTSR